MGLLPLSRAISRPLLLFYWALNITVLALKLSVPDVFTGQWADIEINIGPLPSKLMQTLPAHRRRYSWPMFMTLIFLERPGKYLLILKVWSRWVNYFWMKYAILDLMF